MYSFVYIMKSRIRCIIFGVTSMETFGVMFSMFGTSKFLRMVFSVIEAYDQLDYASHTCIHLHVFNEEKVVII